MFKKVISLPGQNISGLSKSLEDILAKQSAQGFILPGGFVRKKVILAKHYFNVIYSEPRHRRKDPNLLRQHGIIGAQQNCFYEYINSDLGRKKLQIIDAETFNKLSQKHRNNLQPAHFLNPAEFTIPLKLSGHKNNQQDFLMGVNYAPFGAGHFVVWTPAQNTTAGLLTYQQVYQGINQLYWADSLLSQIGDPEYRLFFNARGTGNSSNIFHFQVLREKFPVFAQLSRYYHHNGSEIIYVSRQAWPFQGFLARYTLETKKAVLEALTTHIKHWLKQNLSHTFNLLAQFMPDDRREIFFVKRKSNLIHLQGISNSFSGYEVAGNIVVEDMREYQNFPDRIRNIEWDTRQTGSP
ncbi:MAG: hypothetical protein LBD62_00010 [Candidatus Margulisbacteria bacterium]|jgi:hypothetical protein|nr:hypothetical protein [Candidatus Margulisiibacteriota bacterium]